MAWSIQIVLGMPAWPEAQMKKLLLQQRRAASMVWNWTMRGWSNQQEKRAWRADGLKQSRSFAIKDKGTCCKATKMA